MTVQTDLLKSLLNYDTWRQIGDRVPIDILDYKCKQIYQVLAKSHDKYERDLTSHELNKIYESEYPSMSKDQKQSMSDLFAEINGASFYGPDVAIDLLLRTKDEAVSIQMLELADKFMQKPDERSMCSMIYVPDCQVEDYHDTTTKNTQNSSPWKQLRNLSRPRAIPSQSRSLAELHPCHPADISSFRARPEVGKTSFQASLCAGPGGFAQQGYRVLTLLNEEMAGRVRNRYLSTCIGCSTREILADPDVFEENAALLQANVDIRDATGFRLLDIRRILDDQEVDVLVVDMLDKVQLPGDWAGEHQRLGQLYQDYRDLLKVYDTLGFGGSQVSADGEGRINLDLSMLANSKTGKAAEADIVYLIGKSGVKADNSEVDPTRYINIAKDKAFGLTGRRVTCLLDPQSGRYQS